MPEFKLYKFVKENEKKFLGYFSNEGDLISFINSEFKYRQSMHFDDVKTLQDVKILLANSGGLFNLEEL